MADIKGIELASDIYGLEDETARDNAETNTSAIGVLANLATTAKTNLVAAINEICTNLANLINGDTPVTVTPGFSLRKHGNMVFANISLDGAYFPAQATPMVDASGNQIQIPAALRPKNDVNVFIVDNIRDTVFRLRLTAGGVLFSWSQKYAEQTFELPLGSENSKWQASFSYSLLPF